MGLVSSITREARYLSAALRALGRVKTVRADSPRLAPDDIEAMVRRHPDRPAFIFEDQVTTYAEFDAFANRVAAWAVEQGVETGDTVALFMLNRPEYVGIWYGLAKVGVITALLNNQLAGNGLAHCLNIADCKHVIVGGQQVELFATARPHLTDPPKAWVYDGTLDGAEDLGAALGALPADDPGRARRADLRGADTALKLYTSGTTGLPKAAKVTHVRALNYLNGFAGALNVKPDDRMLIVLPLYHATGGLVGLGAALTSGAAVILERKFSATRFWDVAAQHKATLFTYVGELCRFLAASPPHPRERDHALRGAVGNGLRPDVWERFQARFGVPLMMEFYGATEGNVSLINFDGEPGAVGRIPRYLQHRFNVKIAKFDVEKEEPVRGPDGRCIEAAIGEVGEAVGEIRSDDARFRFEGYEGAEEQTTKKILRNAFKDGDMWFRTGDLMRKGEHGYFYFVDRIGDTFRWKSENVATSEVAEAIGTFPGVKQANVYGVAVEGYDGRAGMAAIVADDSLDLAALHDHLDRELPHFARPVFLRIHPEDAAAHTTGTFKFKKVDLVRDGFDPTLIADPLYLDDPRGQGYTPLDKEVYAAVTGGAVRL